jgi:hypothetical protein
MIVTNMAVALHHDGIDYYFSHRALPSCKNVWQYLGGRFCEIEQQKRVPVSGQGGNLLA